MKKYSFIIIFLCTVTVLSSQDIKPTETGILNVLKTMNTEDNINLNTGKVSVQIPLYTYKDQDFEIPLSLHYSSSGYKVHAPIGSVGLGWNLIAGGYITRKVNGIPDEKNIIFHTIGGGPNGIIGQYHYNKFRSENFSDIINWPRNGDVVYDNDNGTYRYGAKSNSSISNLETTPDLFTFNFLGHKGNFMFNQSIMNVFDTSHPEGEYQIEILKFGYSYLSDTVKIRITTGDGYKYTFEDNTARSTNGMSFWHRTPLYNTHSTYFPLVEIEAPNGRRVYFEYGEKEQNTVSHTYFSRLGDWSPDGFWDPTDYECGYITKGELVLPLKKITIENTDIHFRYSERDNDTIALKPHSGSTHTFTPLQVVSKLKSISVENHNLTEPVKNILFRYEYGKSGGYKRSRRVLLLKEVYTSGEGKYNMDYYHEDNFFPHLLNSRDCWGYWNGVSPHNEGVSTNHNSSTNVETINDENYVTNYKSTLQGMLKTLYYPTGGYTRYYYQQHEYGYKLVKDLRNGKRNNSYLEYVQYDPAGGLRIKRITNYINSQDSVYNDYIYRIHPNNEEMSDYTSTGILLHHPRFYRYAPGVTQVSWLNDFTASEDGTHIAYSKVIKKYPDGSYCEYNFSDYAMFPDLPHNNTVTFRKPYIQIPEESSYTDNFFAKNESRHRIRGKLLSKMFYTADNKLTYSESYSYDFDKFNSDLSKEESSRNPLPSENNIYTVDEAYTYFYIRKHFTRSCQLKSILKTTYPTDNNGTPFTERTNFYYNKIGQQIKKEIVSDNNHIVSTTIQYPYDLRDGFWQNVYDNMYDHGFRNYPVKTISRTPQGITSVLYNVYKNIRSSEYPCYVLGEIKNTEINTPLQVNDYSVEIDSYLKSYKTFNYNLNGLIEEIIMNDGTTTSYVWGGSNPFHPLIVIENATYRQVERCFQDTPELLVKLQIDEDDTIHYISNEIRNELSDAFVNTYTYKPLIGITSKMDSRGEKIYYNYDKNGRLKESSTIKDGKKIMLQAFDYNYNE